MKTFKFKLYNNGRKNKRLLDVISLCGRASNLCISIHRRRYKLFGKKAKEKDLQAHLAKKKDVFKRLFAQLEDRAVSGEIEFPEYDETYQRIYWSGGYLCDIPSQALQQITTRIENGYKAFFNVKKQKSTRRIGVPGFKSARKYKSFTLKQAGWSYEESGFLEQNELTIMKKKYKFFKSRLVDGEIRTVSIKRNSLGEVFVCFSCLEPGDREKLAEDKKLNKRQLELEAAKKYQDLVLKILSASGNTACGIDFGLKDFLVFNDGVKLQSPQFLKESIQELKIASRELSHKQKGSGHWHRAKAVLNRIHEKISNQRLDWARKTAHQICRSFGVRMGFIFIEDLNLAAMKALWGRKISDIAFGLFVRELELIAKKYGILVVKIGRFEKTTGVCVDSGLIKNLELSDRHWFCESCGMCHDRDIMSARCILEAGLSLVQDISVRPCESIGKKRVA